jgi:phospholipase C
MAGNLQNINRFVVLMLENRSFDHLVGYLKRSNNLVDGITGTEYSNFRDPPVNTPPSVPVNPNARATMQFDPSHEFRDVQIQLYGAPSVGEVLPIRASPALMNGFLFSGNESATAQGVPSDADQVMSCFDQSATPNIWALAQQFALFNYWYSSLPGPTWPNRFFVHAATSGGLSDSPDTWQIIRGYSFARGTIYNALRSAGKDWRIYHEGLPQTAGIRDLRLEYINPFTKRFRQMKHFADDVKNGILPEYTFIEPNYDAGNNFSNGNSMHPLNGVKPGDDLVKQVYEVLSANPNYWRETMLIITFDEHGGFYDHVPPPQSLPTGDDTHYANPKNSFDFDSYGVRVPTIVISAYTSPQVIGYDPRDPTTQFDHSSIPATVEDRFNLAPLTMRDKYANLLDVALDLSQPRSAPVLE